VVYLLGQPLTKNNGFGGRPRGTFAASARTPNPQAGLGGLGPAPHCLPQAPTGPAAKYQTFLVFEELHRPDARTSRAGRGRACAAAVAVHFTAFKRAAVFCPGQHRTELIASVGTVRNLPPPKPAGVDLARARALAWWAAGGVGNAHEG